MIKCSKKQLVTFLSNILSNKYGKISIYELNKIRKNKLIEVINKYPDIEKAFETYVKSCDNASEEMKYHDSIIDETIEGQKLINNFYYTEEQFDKIINRINNYPDSLFDIFMFKKYFNSVPFGSISYEKLREGYDRISDIALKMIILKYMINQEIYLADK